MCKHSTKKLKLEGFYSFKAKGLNENDNGYVQFKCLTCRKNKLFRLIYNYSFVSSRFKSIEEVNNFFEERRIFKEAKENKIKTLALSA